MRDEECDKVISVSDSKVITFKDAKHNQYELDLCGEFEIILKNGKYYAERIKPKYPANNEGSDSISDLVLENILQNQNS